MRKYFSVVRWQTIDIHRLRPSWTKEQCAQALAEWEDQLESATIRAGWDFLELAIGIEKRLLVKRGVIPNARMRRPTLFLDEEYEKQIEELVDEVRDLAVVLQVNQVCERLEQRSEVMELGQIAEHDRDHGPGGLRFVA